MRRTKFALFGIPAIALSAVLSAVVSTAAMAEPEFVTIEMEIDVARSAEQVWAKVGDFCAISEWLNIDCAITAGEGGIGTIRSLAGGRITEIMVAHTPLAYGYAQPAVQGEFYNLYHGFMEARPVDASNSKLLYTLVLDVSSLADQAAKDNDVTRRRATFERALGTMKALAEQ